MEAREAPDYGYDYSDYYHGSTLAPEWHNVTYYDAEAGMEGEGRYPVLQTTLKAAIGLGVLANLALIFCLWHTWAYWRQVKFYVIMLAVGNWLEILLSFSLVLKSFISPDFLKEDVTCKAAQTAIALGPIVSNMALPALAVHALLTCITGSQGGALRHAAVIGLFVLLSLSFPLSLIKFSEVHTYGEEHWCSHSNVYIYMYGELLTLIFPLFVSFWLGLAAAIVLCKKGRGNTKGDEDSTDILLLGLLGLLVFLTGSPGFIVKLVVVHSLHVHYSVYALMTCRGILTSIVAVVFGYVAAFRTRGMSCAKPCGNNDDGGERMQLVN